MLLARSVGAGPNCRLRSLIWVCRIVLFAVRKGCVRVNVAGRGDRSKVSALCLLYIIYHRVDHPMNEYMHCFATSFNTRASTTLGELALAIPCCRANQFSESFLATAVRLWNLLLSGVFSGDTLRSFKSAMKLRLQRA